MIDTRDVAAHPWRLLIGGELRDSVRGQRFTTYDPSTGEALASVPDGDEHDIDLAYRAAARAVESWRRFAPRDRAAYVRDLAWILRDNAAELAALDAMDLGSPYPMMLLDVHRAAESLDLFADYALQLAGSVIPATSDHLHYTVRQPFGVVARILPFNHPIMFAAGKIAAPLVAGNSVIVQPAHQTPLSALRMGEMFADVLPAGVLNIVTGSGTAPGEAIAAHRGIRRIAFTGSERTGRAIQVAAARAAVKCVTLELGGKNAMVVLDDADVPAAANGAVSGMNFGTSAGQFGGATSRLLVHSSLAEEVVERVVRRVRALKVGPAMESTVDVGPLVSRQRADQVLAYIGAAQRDGATVACGGDRPDLPGYFVSPTVLTHVRPGMSVFSEEISGPVLSVVTFDDDAEALQLANAVDYGLTASVWTSGLDRAHQFAAAFEAGFVWVNGASQHFPGVPYGGVKSSGIGREECLEELLSFTQTKAVTVFNGMSDLGYPDASPQPATRVDDLHRHLFGGARVRRSPH